MRTVIFLAAAVAAIALAPVATAAPGDCYGVHQADADCGGHAWNGPRRQVEDTPGFYGGQNGGDPELCSPFSYQCSGAVPTR